MATLRSAAPRYGEVVRCGEKQRAATNTHDGASLPDQRLAERTAPVSAVVKTFFRQHRLGGAAPMESHFSVPFREMEVDRLFAVQLPFRPGPEGGPSNGGRPL